MNRKNDHKEPPLSLTQQAYVLADSLKEVINGLIGCLVLIILYFLLGVLVNDPIMLLMIVVVLLSPFLIFMVIKSIRFYKELNIWKEQYLQNSYILIFDTTVPVGSSIQHVEILMSDPIRVHFTSLIF